MKQIIKQQEKLRDELLPLFKGSLTSSNLSAFLDIVKRTVQKQLDIMSETDEQEIVVYTKTYISPKDLKNGDLTSEMVLQSLALDVLIEEYFMTFTSLPELKSQLWSIVENDGLSFSIWSNILAALRNSKGS